MSISTSSSRPLLIHASFVNIFLETWNVSDACYSAKSSVLSETDSKWSQLWFAPRRCGSLRSNSALGGGELLLNFPRVSHTYSYKFIPECAPKSLFSAEAPLRTWTRRLYSSEHTYLAWSLVASSHFYSSPSYTNRTKPRRSLFFCFFSLWGDNHNPNLFTLVTAMSRFSFHNPIDFSSNAKRVPPSAPGCIALSPKSFSLPPFQLHDQATWKLSKL